MDEMPLRLRDSVLVFNQENRLQFICTMELRVIEFNVLPYVVELIPLLDGTNSIEAIELALDGTPGFTRQSLKDVLTVMRDQRLLDRHPQIEHPGTYRFERQARLFHEFASTFSLDASPSQLQELLEASKVVVVGTGGTGTWLLQSLLAAGVGSFEIFDPDYVELTNLNRQVLYRPEDVGRSKVVAASDRLRAINESVNIKCHPVKIDSPVALNAALRDASVPIKGRTRSGGSLAAVSGLVANLTAWEALRLLLSLPLALSNQVRELDLFTLEWRIRKIAPRPGCQACENVP
ncbi:ThiF family adenylyltransferase [Arthrobacter sp. GN70]|uniref:ThiF family adenylyltransferase n=1 Tax=Arthrobacter terricola TaxID=2547396 RepID=A0A4R5L284_9MICC|nr:ThiF family adenylyltransferase [Arthrobacter sp. GN70]TDG01525.1 ThiF family adenylyltransferase [Arthrobacter terricola]